MVNLVKWLGICGLEYYSRPDNAASRCYWTLQDKTVKTKPALLCDIHVILLLRFHLKMKDLFQNNLEIKKDKASLKHFMTRYKTLSVNCFLDFHKIWLPPIAWILQFFLTVLMIPFVISLIGGSWPDILLTLMFNSFIISKKNKAYFLIFISNLFVNKLYDLFFVDKIR